MYGPEQTQFIENKFKVVRYGPQQTQSMSTEYDLQKKEKVREYLQKLTLGERLQELTSQMDKSEHLRDKNYKKKQDVELEPITEETLLEYENMVPYDEYSKKMPRFIQIIDEKNHIKRQFIRGEVYDKLIEDQELANRYVNL
jgi:hypothetical protein